MITGVQKGKLRQNRIFDQETVTHPPSVGNCTQLANSQTAFLQYTVNNYSWASESDRFHSEIKEATAADTGHPPEKAINFLDIDNRTQLKSAIQFSSSIYD